MLLSSIHFSLPVEDPLLKFLLILVIILLAPLLLNKIKIPHLLGLIIAGALIGPNGLDVLPRDSSVVVLGTTGLLFIMFLAGLEIDLEEFKKNKWKSMTFGLYTFSLPLALGILSGHYLLGYNWLTSILFASIFSSHTLIAYPMVSQLNLVKNRAVNITVGGTMITDIMALLVLAVCVGIVQGEVNTAFWTRLSISIAVFAAVVTVGFPLLGRWFFKKVDDKIAQFIFVMVMIYLGGLFAALAGIEPIIGAFLAGLSFNRLIPHSSTLMNRINFVGNSLFIPFFLISVGMLIDFRAFIKDFETIKVALIMTTMAMAGKYLASVATQKTFRLTRDEGRLIFGLSTASAAATLAAVLVGYNIILGETESGEPIRLLNEHILNGSILMILVSCTVSSFTTQKSAAAVAAKEQSQLPEDSGKRRFLLATYYESTVEPLINLANYARSSSDKEPIYVLSVLTHSTEDVLEEKNAQRLLNKATEVGAAAEITIETVRRYDSDVIHGIGNEIKEHSSTDLFIGVAPERGFSPSFVYNLYNGYLKNNKVNIGIYHAQQPISTIATNHVLIPPRAFDQNHFLEVLSLVWNLSKNAGSKALFYSTEQNLKILESIRRKKTVDAEFIVLSDWNLVEELCAKIKPDEAFISVMARPGDVSYQTAMHRIPNILQKQFENTNYLLLYPRQEPSSTTEPGNSLHREIKDYQQITDLVEKLFK